jgi:PIN domain nuclease of toxin-antitoxin system
MKLLLDTHVVLWWLHDDPRLGPSARALISGGDVQLWFSVASLWEISIKHRIGKLGVNAAQVAAQLPIARISVLPIKVIHLTELERLPLIHRDPFDRMLLAQAIVEPAQLMTNDAILGSYGVPCVATD